MRIRLIWEGKTKDEHLRALQVDYATRISHFTELKVEELRPGRSSRPGKPENLSTLERRLLERIQSGYKIALDERGREWTSDEFAQWIGQCALRGTRELAFLVGGPEGFSAAFRGRADVLLSLSRLTLTHEWARALLLEQIYRAFATQRGHPYPR